MLTGAGSEREAHRVQGAVAIAGVNGASRSSRAVKRRHRMIVLYVVLNLLRDRRFREDAILGAITVAALARIIGEDEVHARARLIAWWKALPVAP